MDLRYERLYFGRLGVLDNHALRFAVVGIAHVEGSLGERGVGEDSGRGGTSWVAIGDHFSLQASRLLLVIPLRLFACQTPLIHARSLLSTSLQALTDDYTEFPPSPWPDHSVRPQNAQNPMLRKSKTLRVRRGIPVHIQ